MELSADQVRAKRDLERVAGLLRAAYAPHVEVADELIERTYRDRVGTGPRFEALLAALQTIRGRS
jgi:hypothetical protein